VPVFITPLQISQYGSYVCRVVHWSGLHVVATYNVTVNATVTRALNKRAVNAQAILPQSDSFKCLHGTQFFSTTDSYAVHNYLECHETSILISLSTKARY